MWKKVARLLGLEDTIIKQIAINEQHNVYEQSYQMLDTWKKSQKNSDALCAQLEDALCDDLVKKNNVAQQYCYLPKK